VTGTAVLSTFSAARAAVHLADAIASAARAIESAGLTALRVVDEDLLTLADIADRIGQSRESVRRYATGERGPGDFPPPVNPSREGTAFYRWSEVAPWIRERIGIDVPDIDPALVVANLVLQARQHRNKVAHLSALTDLLAA
jgi:predicted DNA-binding transcriptional regulator AlpA